MPRRGSRHRVAKNISSDATGHAVRFQIAGESVEKRFPPNTSLKTLEDWRDDEKRKLKRRLKEGKLPEGSFAADAAAYLKIVKAMTDFAQRQQHIGEWVEILGADRKRSEDLDGWRRDIAAQATKWLLEGPKRVQQRIDGKMQWRSLPEPLSPQSVALRLRALANLWTVLDGRHAPNPAREVEEPDPRDEEARGLPAAVVDAIIAAAPEWVRVGGRIFRSKSEIRARAIRWTGLAHVEVKRIKPHHIQLDETRVWIAPRKKGRRGRGTRKQKRKGRWVPLVPEAVQAFTDFIEYDCFGPFSNSAFHSCFQRWCRAAGYGDAGIRPYDLRHSVGTDAYAASGDLAAVGELLGQADPRTTARYARAAMNPRVRDVIQRMREKQIADATQGAKPGTDLGTEKKTA